MSPNAAKGPRCWVKLDKARKRAQFAAADGLPNVDHQVWRKVADLAVAHGTGTIVLVTCANREKHLADRARQGW